MSDPFLTEFWRTAPAPWNTLGPEIAAGMLSPDSNQLVRWARQLRQARLAQGLAQGDVCEGVDLCRDGISKLERAMVGKNYSGWAKLSAFYGITLE